MNLVGGTLGQYQVLGELGRGQHAVVYRAWQESLGRPVALKVLQGSDQRTLKFQAEARLTAHLIQQGVPHVRQVYEVGETQEGYLYVAMEYVEDSLHNVLHRACEGKRQIEPRAAAHLLQPIAQALDALHQLGWAHLDVKPQNILLAQDGRALLADFGIAERQGSVTQACSPAYASPEQAAGDQPVGPWSDIYSLGVVLYQMVTGNLPFSGEHDVVALHQHLNTPPPCLRSRSGQAKSPRLTAAQERAILKALSKRPQKRQRAASELIQAVLGADSTREAMLRSTPAGLSRTRGAELGGRPVRQSATAVPVSTREGASPMLNLALVGAAVLVLLAILFLVGRTLWLQLGGRFGPQSTAPAPMSTGEGTLPQLTLAAPGKAKTAAPPPAATATATATESPLTTATLAPTSTRTPRPTPQATPVASPQPSATPAAGSWWAVRGKQRRLCSAALNGEG